MSLRAMNAVKENADKTNARKFLALLALADFADDEGVCWPSIATVAEWIGTGEKQARRYIREWIDDGIVTVIRKGGGRYTNLDGEVVGIPNRYQIDIPSLAGEGSSKYKKVSPTRENHSSPKNNNDPSPETPDPSHDEPDPSLKTGGESSVKTISINPQEDLKDSLSHRQKQSLQGELEKYFAIQTQLAIPPRVTQKQKKAAKVRWWDPLWEMLELCNWDLSLAMQGVKLTLEEMDRDALTFDSPQSTIKTFRSLVAKAKRGRLRPRSEPRGLQGGREFLEGAA